MNPRVSHFLRTEWLQLLLILLPLLATFFAQPYASEPVPIRWNLSGQAIGFAPQSWGLMLTPVLIAFTIVLIFFFENRDRYRLGENGELSSHGRAVRTIRIGISILFAILCVIQIAWATGHHPDSAKWIPCGIALLIAFIGNFLGKLKPNRYVGIRVPWTLNSETVWRLTHRFAGQLWTGSGLFVAAAVWLLPSSVLSAFTAVWFAILVFLPLAFAWKCAKSES